MKLENQVCSLDLAKRLKELGVKQESLFTWVLGIDEETRNTSEYKIVIIGNKGWTDYIAAGADNKEKGEMFSAFTVAELGEMLPRPCMTYKHEDFDGFKCLRKMNECSSAETESDARAKMLVYLLENKLITL